MPRRLNIDARRERATVYAFAALYMERRRPVRVWVANGLVRVYLGQGGRDGFVVVDRYGNLDGEHGRRFLASLSDEALAWAEAEVQRGLRGGWLPTPRASRVPR